MSARESVVGRLEDASSLDPATRFVRARAAEVLASSETVDRLLGGDWLGHRLHPLAAQVPMGAFLMATGLSLTGREKYDDAIDALLLAGIASSVPAAVAGAHDIAATTDPQARVGLVHAAAMDATVLLYTAALVSRRRGHRRRGRALALAGAAVAGGGAYLGGHLVFRMGVGVDAPAR